MVRDPIEIQLNGKPHTLAAESTLAQLIEGLGRDPRLVAVERNGDIVPRDRYAATRLEAGDRLEVVQFVQGGAGLPSGPVSRYNPPSQWAASSIGRATDS